MRFTLLELPMRDGDPLRLREGKVGLLHTENRALWGGRRGQWVGPPHMVHIAKPPSSERGMALSHALLEAATRGQALPSHQEHRNHQVSGSPGTGASQKDRLAAQQPRRAPEKEAGSREEFGL